MNFLLPDQRALCLAENATHNLHNLLTLRGALVRDPRSWSRYLTEAISVAHHGDLGVLQRPLSVLETQHATFAIVTP
jgi:alkyl sulfatase BDS1-like metallo-beta-lactamase superfamily hydrolase